MVMHRHHISYKLGLVVRIPAWYHWLIHVPGAFFMSGTAWWTGKSSWGCVRYQNLRAKSMGLRLVLGYPNLIQIVLNLIAWVIWGYGWAFCVGLAIALAII